MDNQNIDDITELIGQLRSAKQDIAGKLFPLLYDELKRMARSKMRRERQGHTLSPTALLHEAYIRLSADRERSWENRTHFMGVAASVMRRVLIDYARRRSAEKRGGDMLQVTLDETLVGRYENVEVLLDIDMALDEMALYDARQARVVEYRFFGGLNYDEIAEMMDISAITARRDWRHARAWLKSRLNSLRDR